MPIYVYHCSACGVDIEKRQSFADAPLAACDDCGGPVRRVLQPVGIIFKGSGFYITDSRNGANGKNGSTGNGASGNGESGGTTSKAEATASSSDSSK
jgi:putative FmdB family regulatory protein